jgi:hypothetical protein
MSGTRLHFKASQQTQHSQAAAPSSMVLAGPPRAVSAGQNSMALALALELALTPSLAQLVQP